MTLRHIALQRLGSQQLAGSGIQAVEDLVTCFGAIQAQEYAQAKWGLGLRLPHLTDRDVEAALTSGLILRTHLLRPTWHFVAAADIRWLLQLTAPRVHAVNAYMYRQTGLDAPLFRKCHRLLVQALEGSRYQTRTQLATLLQEHGIEATGTRLACIMMQAELEGLICSGPRQGSQHTYALLGERVPLVPARTREEALHTLTQRYFTSRGPATVQDFAAWSGLTLTDCRQGIQLAGNALEAIHADGDSYYTAGNTASVRQAAPALCLLPIYDELIIGYKDRSALVQGPVATGSQPVPVFDNTILYKGQIIGTWKRTVKRTAIGLSLHFLTPPGKPVLLALQEGIHRLEAFTGLPVKLETI